MRSERGAVLVFVLWVLAMLTMVGGFYAVEARIRRNVGQVAWDSVQGRETVRSILMLLATDNRQARVEGRQSAARQERMVTGTDEEEEKGFFSPNGVVHTMDFGGQEITYSVESENGKLDLNNATEEQLIEVLEGVIGPHDEDIDVKTLVEAILDWRDPDNVERSAGLEDEVYEQETPPYHPANGPFRFIEELALVHGMTRNLFLGPLSYEGEEGSMWEGRLGDLFTIYNSSGNVSKEQAPLPLRELLSTGLSEGSQQGGVLRLTVRAGTQTYEVFTRMDGGPGGDISRPLHWREAMGVRSASTE